MRGELAGHDILVELARAIWRHRRIAFFVFLATACLPVAAWFALTPKYEASALVHVAQMAGSEAPSTRNRNGDMSEPVMIRTEVLILGSDALANRVIQQLKLAQRPEFAGGGRKADPEADQVEVQREANRLLEVYKRNVSIFNDGRSAIAVVSFRSSDPNLASDVANAHARAYLESRAQRKLEPFEVSESRIVSPAVVPSTPNSRKSSILLIFGIAFAAAAGLLGALTAHYFLWRNWSLDALAGRLHLAPLVSLPTLRADLYPQDSTRRVLFDLRMVNLLGKLRLNAKQGRQVICVTSAASTYESTLVLREMALALQSQGVSVALIDADLADAKLTASLGIDNPVSSLNAWLSGTATLPEVVDQRERFAVLPSRAEGAMAHGRFSPDRFGSIVRFARTNYAVTLISLPPLWPYQDLPFSTAECEGLVIVANSHTPRVEFLEKSVSKLTSEGSRISGLVMTGKDPEDEKILSDRALAENLRQSLSPVAGEAGPVAAKPANPIAILAAAGARQRDHILALRARAHARLATSLEVRSK